MGQVLRAQDLLNGRPVAVKVIHQGADRERFLREALVLAGLNHPGIVGYVAHGVTGEGRPYLVMEWLQGEELAQRLRAGPLELLEAVRLVRKITAALSVAHRAGIIHRDLKPSNLLLQQGQLERVTILDFGIAGDELHAEDPGRQQQMTGTPLYMAPEQIQGTRTSSPAADVYSLGCVLYACVTGRPPLASDNLMSLLHQVMVAAPQRLREVRPELPPAADLLEPLLGRMLAKQPSARPVDAGALLGELDALLATLAPALGEVGAASSKGTAAAELELATALWIVPPADAVLERGSAAEEAISAAGAELVPRDDGSILLTFSSNRMDCAGDQVALAVAVAQRLLRQWPQAAALIATGRRPLPASPQLGEIGRHLDVLRAGQRPGQILLSQLSGELLDARFPVAQLASAAGYVLSADFRPVDALSPRLRRQLGRLLPCIGRDRDLGVVSGILLQSADDSQAHAVLVVGPAGIGKSRLRQELLERIRARDEDIDVLSGRAEPLQSGVAGSLVASLFALDTPVSAADAPALTKRVREACAKRPQALIVEDLQWADNLSIRILDELLEELSAQPLFVLGLGRPEVTTRFPSLWTERRIQHVRLPALTRRSVERLVSEAMGVDWDPELRARLVAQADGNPLVLEELVRHAAAQGAAAQPSDGLESVPETVLAMFQARLGRLEPGARRVLLAASAFGEQFPLGGVQSLLAGAQTSGETARWLEILTAQELIVRKPESRYPGDVELAFRSSLLCAAAAALLIDEARLHNQAAAAQYLAAAKPA